MTKKKNPIQNLTIQNNFMFGQVMMNEEICRHTIELALGFPIEKVSIVLERSMQYHPEYHGIRLDVFARDEKKTHYNVEMQVKEATHLVKRARYYHDQMDMELLATGESYEKLPESYVIFICCFDPFGDARYCYTVSNHCEETGKSVNDGMRTIYLSTKGENPEEVPPELVSFLKYVEENDPSDQEKGEDEDPFVKSIKARIREIKADREKGERYMLFELMMRDERRAGREEGLATGREEGLATGREEGLATGRAMARGNVLFFLEGLGPVSEEVRELVESQMDTEVLMSWIAKAARASSVEAFVEEIQK